MLRYLTYGLIVALGLSGCSTGSRAPSHAPIPVSRNVGLMATSFPVSEADLECLSEAVYFEARGAGNSGAEAVAHVILNRVRHAKFPDDVCAVIAQKCQFSYRCDGLPEVYSETEAYAWSRRVAHRVLAGARDNTGGALFFHARTMPPGWFGTLQRVGNIGGNIFYR